MTGDAAVLNNTAFLDCLVETVLREGMRKEGEGERREGTLTNASNQDSSYQPDSYTHTISLASDTYVLTRGDATFTVVHALKQHYGLIGKHPNMRQQHSYEILAKFTVTTESHILAYGERSYGGTKITASLSNSEVTPVPAGQWSGAIEDVEALEATLLYGTPARILHSHS